MQTINVLYLIKNISQSRVKRIPDSCNLVEAPEDIDYADDVCLLPKNKQNMQSNINDLVTACRKCGINNDETKLLKIIAKETYTYTCRRYTVRNGGGIHL